MPIFRVNQSHESIILPKRLAQDPSLSYTALGLLVHLYAVPEACTSDLRELITPLDDRATIVAALKELVHAGYLDTEDETAGGER